MGNYNVWNGDRVKEDKTSTVGIQSENENRRRIVERMLCVGNNYFKRTPGCLEEEKK